MHLTADLIRRAKAGDLFAMKQLQEYFEGYITSLSILWVKESDGTVKPYLDSDIQEELREAVIEGTLKFDEARRTR